MWKRFLRTAAGRLTSSALILLALALLPVGAQTSSAGAVPVSAGVTSTAAATAYTWPIRPQPPVLTPFAPPANRYGAGHRGVDLGAAPGTSILAAGSGVVIFAGTLVDRGVVSIEHAGGLRTTYEPVTASVVKGARVSVGQIIGVLEPGHLSCAPSDCLHWGAKIGDDYLNPLSLLGPLEVRLKPWGGLVGTPP